MHYRIIIVYSIFPSVGKGRTENARYCSNLRLCPHGFGLVRRCPAGDGAASCQICRVLPECLRKRPRSGPRTAAHAGPDQSGKGPETRNRRSRSGIDRQCLCRCRKHHHQAGRRSGLPIDATAATGRDAGVVHHAVARWPERCSANSRSICHFLGANTGEPSVRFAECFFIGADDRVQPLSEYLIRRGLAFAARAPDGAALFPEYAAAEAAASKAHVGIWSNASFQHPYGERYRQSQTN